jgi:hypothetical protein
MADLYSFSCWRHCLGFSDFLRGEPDDMIIRRWWCLCIVTFLKASFLKNLLCSSGVPIGDGGSCYFLAQFSGDFLFPFFWLCVSLMSLLPLDTMVSEAGFSWYMLGIKILSLSTKWKYLRKHGKWAITMMTTNQAKTTSRGFYILQKNTLCWGGDANI